MNRPRDSRGWLIYEGDWVRNSINNVLVRVDKTFGNVLSLSNKATLFSYHPKEPTIVSSWSEYLYVDLSRSLTRTNYERWFADLGTLEDVKEAFDAQCDDMCYSCPLSHWGTYFHTEMKYGGCFSFNAWLAEEAVRL